MGALEAINRITIKVDLRRGDGDARHIYFWFIFFAFCHGNYLGFWFDFWGGTINQQGEALFRYHFNTFKSDSSHRPNFIIP